MGGEKSPLRFGNCLRAIFNPDEKTCFGRTALSWLYIFIFYFIFFVTLAGFFIGMLSVFLFSYVQDDVPSLTGYQSLLRFDPGLSVCPNNVNNTFVHLSVQKSIVNNNYLDAVHNLLNQYKERPEVQECDINSGTKPVDDIDKPCHFNLSYLGPCANPEEALYSGNPCIYLKLNKIYGWIPDLPEDSTYGGILVECRGQNPADKLHLRAPVYHPSTSINTTKYGAISHVFYPFVRQRFYQTPLVAVQFPSIEKNVITLVECRTSGIVSTNEAVKFEIVVDDVQ